MNRLLLLVALAVLVAAVSGGKLGGKMGRKGGLRPGKGGPGFKGRVGQVRMNFTLL